jgi:DNA-binding transcriptional LysR family regulator
MSTKLAAILVSVGPVSTTSRTMAVSDIPRQRMTAILSSPLPLEQGLVYGPRLIAASALADGRLRIVELGVLLINLDAIRAVTHPDSRPATKTRAWIEFLSEELPKQKSSLSGHVD